MSWIWDTQAAAQMFTFRHGMLAACAALWQPPIVFLCRSELLGNEFQHVLASHFELTRVQRWNDAVRKETPREQICWRNILIGFEHRFAEDDHSKGNGQGSFGAISFRRGWREM